jgi:hypothetical protein
LRVPGLSSQLGVPGAPGSQPHKWSRDQPSASSAFGSGGKGKQTDRSDFRNNRRRDDRPQTRDRRQDSRQQGDDFGNLFRAAMQDGPSGSRSGHARPNRHTPSSEIADPVAALSGRGQPPRLDRGQVPRLDRGSAPHQGSKLDRSVAPHQAPHLSSPSNKLDRHIAPHQAQPSQPAVELSDADLEYYNRRGPSQGLAQEPLSSSFDSDKHAPRRNRDHGRDRDHKSRGSLRARASDADYVPESTPKPAVVKPRKAKVLKPVQIDVYIPSMCSVGNLARLLGVRLEVLQRKMVRAGMGEESSYDHSQFHLPSYTTNHTTNIKQQFSLPNTPRFSQPNLTGTRS